MKKAVSIILALLFAAALAACARGRDGNTPKPTNDHVLPTFPAATKKPSDGYASRETSSPGEVVRGRLQRFSEDPDIVVTGVRLDGDRNTEDNTAEPTRDGIREHFSPGETMTAYIAGSVNETTGRVKAVLLPARSASDYIGAKLGELEKEAIFSAVIGEPGQNGLVFTCTVPGNTAAGDYDLVFFSSGNAVYRVTVKITG